MTARPHLFRKCLVEAWKGHQTSFEQSKFSANCTLAENWVFDYTLFLQKMSAFCRKFELFNKKTNIWKLKSFNPEMLLQCLMKVVVWVLHAPVLLYGLGSPDRPHVPWCTRDRESHDACSGSPKGKIMVYQGEVFWPGSLAVTGPSQVPFLCYSLDCYEGTQTLAPWMF